VLLFGAIVLVGCGGPREGYISGHVTYKKKAVTIGRVNFHDAKDKTFSADLGPEGHYILRAPPGEYKVTVRETPTGAPPPNPTGKLVRSFPERYADAGRSGLSAKVQRGDNRHDFDLAD
jgi:hypothetical protein